MIFLDDSNLRFTFLFTANLLTDYGKY